MLVGIGVEDALLGGLTLAPLLPVGEGDTDGVVFAVVGHGAPFSGLCPIYVCRYAWWRGPVLRLLAWHRADGGRLPADPFVSGQRS